MNYFKYKPTYSGKPIEETNSYLKELENTYDLNKQSKNKLDIFLSGFQSTDDDGKEYIDTLKSTLKNNVDEIAKDSKGNIKWAEATTVLDGLATKLATDNKLKHIQSRYNSYQEDEKIKREAISKYGKQSYYENENQSRAFDDEGNPIQYSPRITLKQDHNSAANVIVKKIQPLLTDTLGEYSGYLGTSRVEEIDPAKMQEVLDFAFQESKSNPALQQMLQFEGEDAVKELLYNALGTGSYSYDQVTVGKKSGADSNSTIPMDNLFTVDKYAPDTNETKDLEPATSDMFGGKAQTGLVALRSPKGFIPIMSKLKPDTEKGKTYNSILKAEGYDVDNMSPTEKTRVINERLEEFNSIAKTIVGYSTIIKPNGVNSNLVGGFNQEAKNIAFNKSSILVIGEGGEGKDTKDLRGKLSSMRSDLSTDKEPKKEFKGIYIGNNKNPSKYDGGLMFTLTDSEGNSEDVVIPNQDLNASLSSDIVYWKDKAKTAKDPKAFQLSGSIGKEKTALEYYIPDSLLESKDLTVQQAKLYRALELRQYARYNKGTDGNSSSMISGSTIYNEALPTGTTESQVIELLDLIGVPYKKDPVNNNVVIDDTFIQQGMNNTVTNSRIVSNSTLKKLD